MESAAQLLAGTSGIRLRRTPRRTERDTKEEDLPKAGRHTLHGMRLPGLVSFIVRGEVRESQEKRHAGNWIWHPDMGRPHPCSVLYNFRGDEQAEPGSDFYNLFITLVLLY
jgi:hypothetical protein